MKKSQCSTKQMANGTNSSHKAEHGENSNGKLKQGSEKGRINSCPNASDITGLKRSLREISSKKAIPLPSSTRKSERLEKRIPTARVVQRKFKRAEKQKMPSPLRRSGRLTSQSSLSPSDSKSSGTSNSNQKMKKEKSVKQLTVEAKEVNENVDCGLGTSQVNIKTMDARMYRSIFKKPKEDCLVEPNRMDESTHEGGKNGGDKIDKFSKGSHLDCTEISKNVMLPSEGAKTKEMIDDTRSSGPMKGLLENNVTQDTSVPSNATTCVTSVVRVQPDSCREETLQLSVSRNSLMEDSVRNNVGHGSGEHLVPSKINGTIVDMDLDVSATLANDDTCNLIADACPSRLGGNNVGTGGSCSKRLRLDCDHAVSSQNESSDPSAAEENIAETLHDCQSDREKDGFISNSSNSVAQLKEQVPSHIAYRCKSDSFRFVEYWVPVQISHVQLEQYCATLLKNASILRSSSKVDTVGALRDVLISTRKCCNHPYTVDDTLQSLLTKDIQVAEILDVGIKASGKLQLLDSMLRKLRKKNLRALVLFQFIGGSGRDSIGDILDDFLRQRFGSDSYERIDKGLSNSKMIAAMRKFNNKDNGQFVFLLETSGCRSSIKLSSVDAIVIFDSDWNPMNDIRSLQKITLDSQFDLIKVFRLYSSFTVEENALILAKQEKPLDINLPNMSCSTSQMLLMRGASCLFDDLRAFHDGETSMPSLTSISGQPLHEVVVREFKSVLSQNDEDTDKSNCSVLFKVQRSGGTYRPTFSLFGEMKLRLLDEEPPHIFWTKLFEGKQFRWKYSRHSSQRSRKRVHHFDGSVDRPNPVGEAVSKKRRKVSNNLVDQPSKSEGVKLSTGTKAERLKGNDVKFEKKSSVQDEQRNLQILLKPEIAKLCEVLHLPDNVKHMADSFLEYVMNNHHVNREPVSILQAFQISLTWTAASLSKHKLDHKDSLILAKQFLNFVCKKEEVDYIYSILRCLKKIFLYRTENANVPYSPKAFESSNRVLSSTGVPREVELFNKDVSKSIKEIRKKCQKQLIKLHHMQQEKKQQFKAAIDNEKASIETNYQIKLKMIRTCSPNDMMRAERIRVLNSEYVKRIEELEFQHEIQIKEFEDKLSAERRKFQEREDSWVDDVDSWVQNELKRIVDSKKCPTMVENLQTPDQVQSNYSHAGPVSDHLYEGKGCDNMVEAMTGTGTRVPETDSLAVVPCSRPVELQIPLGKHIGANGIDIMPSEGELVPRSEGNNIGENQFDKHGNMISAHSHSREQNSVGATSIADEDDECENVEHGSQDECGDVTAKLGLPSSETGTRVPETDSPAVVLCSSPVELEIPLVKQIYANEMDIMASEGESVHRSEANNIGENQFDDHGNMISKSHLREQNVGATSIANEGDGCENVGHGSPNECGDDTVASVRPSSNGEMCDAKTSDREASVGTHGTANVSNGPENVTAVDTPLSLEQIPDRSAVNEVIDSELSNPCAATSSSNCPDSSTRLNPPLDQNHDCFSSRILDGQNPVEVPESSHEGGAVITLEREVPEKTPGMVNFTVSPGIATFLYPLSSRDQISEGVSLNVPALNSVSSSTPCYAAGSSGDAVKISLLNPPLEQQGPDGGSLSIPVGKIQVVMQENSQEAADCPEDMEPSTNTALVDKSTTSGQQERVPITLTKNVLSQEMTVSRSADAIEPLEQMQQLSSVESPPVQDTVGKLQNTSQQVELVSGPVDVTPANESNHDSLLMEPSEQVQQLLSAEVPSSNQDSSNLCLATGSAHPPINEDDPPNQSSGVSTVVPNLGVMHPDLNLEHGSHLHQVGVHLPSNPDLGSLTPGGVRTQASDTRNLSSPSVTRMLPNMHSDPLQIESERIRKEKEQTEKNHENMKVQLQSDFEKEYEELRRKYDIKLQEIEAKFQQEKKSWDTILNTVAAHKNLADAFRSKCMDYKLTSATGMQQASRSQQLFQPSRQQGATRPSMVAAPSTAVSHHSPSAVATSLNMFPPIQAPYNPSRQQGATRPSMVAAPSSAVIHPSPSAVASSQNMVPPIQAAYNPSRQQGAARPSMVAAPSSVVRHHSPSAVPSSPNMAPSIQPAYNTLGIFSGASARQPLLNSFSSPSANLHAGGEIRAPAPHLQPYRPPTSVPASSPPAPPHGMQDGIATRSLPTRDLRVNNNSQSAINLPIVRPRISDTASLNPSRVVTKSSTLASSSNRAASPYFVNLVDDDSP